MPVTPQEVMVIVNRWIGVSGGYLGDFTYRSHAEFYPEYCDVLADPEEYPGTTRERFISILQNASPPEQAKIVRGVIERFPREAAKAPATRTLDLERRLYAIADRVEREAAVQVLAPEETSEAVRRALADAETLIRTADAANAVDRVYTALHGHLLALAAEVDEQFEVNAGITIIWRRLCQRHRAFATTGPRREDVAAILQSFAAVLDHLQPIRNRASLAHANPVLNEPEAVLAINAARTVFQYVCAKVECARVIAGNQ